MLFFLSGGSSKKASYDPNRSGAALEHGLSHSFSYPSAVNNLQPTQPISQDPQMPLLNPPNPTHQLEEARRRLLDDDKLRAMSMRSSKSFTVSQGSKDKRNAMPPPPPPRGIPPSNKHIPPQSDLSDADRSTSFSRE